MPYKQKKLNNKITKSTSSTFLVSSRNIKNRSCENIRINKNNSNIIPYKLKNNPNFNDNQSSIITTNIRHKGKVLSKDRFNENKFF